MLPVLPRFTDSDYSLGIVKLFLVSAINIYNVIVVLCIAIIPGILDRLSTSEMALYLTVKFILVIFPSSESLLFGIT